MEGGEGSTSHINVVKIILGGDAADGGLPSAREAAAVWRPEQSASHEGDAQVRRR